jgi:DNA-binding LacI/PurR family transcriptional regulator
MHQLIAAGVRGIIAASLGQLVQEEFAQHGPEGAIPVVYCDQPFEVDESITFGDADAGFELAAHLAGHGHRRISFMTPSIEYPNMANLLSGLKRAVSQDLIEDVDVIRCADFSVDAGMAAATTALTSPSPPTAIATAADEIALGVIDATRAIGLRIPQDLSLVSYGAIEASAYTDPSITTIALPAEQMGALAARRLAARIRGEPAEGTTILPGRLIVRASCGPHAA